MLDNLRAIIASLLTELRIRHTLPMIRRHFERIYLLIQLTNTILVKLGPLRNDRIIRRRRHILLHMMLLLLNASDAERMILQLLLSGRISAHKTRIIDGGEVHSVRGHVVGRRRGPIAAIRVDQIELIEFVLLLYAPERGRSLGGRHSASHNDVGSVGRRGFARRATHRVTRGPT